MHLKFQEVSWDERGLMYVLFKKDRKEMRWYPKWKDVADLISSTFATESGMNREKLMPYLTFTCLEVLAIQTFKDLAFDSEMFRKFYDAIELIKEALLKTKSPP